MRDFLREDVFIKAAKLAAVCTAAIAPNMLDSYFFNPGYREVILSKVPQTAVPFLFLRDLALVFVSLMISAACGFAWSDGQKVAGFGALEGLKKNLKTVAILGVVLGAATALLFDLRLAKTFRKFYPENPLALVGIPLRAGFYEEVICRFGILAIVFRLTRSPIAAIILSAGFNAVVGLTSATFVGFPIGMDWQTATILANKFLVAVFFGYFYCKKGLMATIALRLIMESKHIVLALALPR